MSRASLRVGGVVASVVALVAACSIEAVDVANKGCPCGDGYVCDEARNACVRPGDLVDGGDGDSSIPSCANDQCPCAIDSDCKDPARRKCSPAKVCVECATSPDSCAIGSYCNARLQCTPGCKQESDCQISPAAPHCALGRHQCVECVTTADCGDGGKLCSPAGACVEGCDVDAGKSCSGGKSCCDSLCLDTTADPLNCGGCGTTCSTVNGTPKCAAGACNWTCASGFGHCDPGNTGCETNVRTSLTRCGSCGRNCTTGIQHANGVTCNAGSCGYTSCSLNFGDCDGNGSNGCECACGAAAGDICCPGSVCNFPGGKCSVGSGKCTP